MPSFRNRFQTKGFTSVAARVLTKRQHASYDARLQLPHARCSLSTATGRVTMARACRRRPRCLRWARLDLPGSSSGAAGGVRAGVGGSRTADTTAPPEIRRWRNMVQGKSMPLPPRKKIFTRALPRRRTCQVKRSCNRYPFACGRRRLGACYGRDTVPFGGQDCFPNDGAP